MTTEAKNVKFRRQLAQLEAARRNPEKSKMRPRDKIRVRMRCKICGRGRAVYRKFGICRICFRNLASDGLIPGVTKASW
jgi:small subunit ribosomal protein S14